MMTLQNKIDLNKMLPKTLIEASAIYRAAEKAAYAAFDAVPNGRKKIEKQAKEEARLTLKVALKAADDAYYAASKAYAATRA